MIDIKENYAKSIKLLQDHLGLTNVHALPKIDKVTLSVGTGPIRGNKDLIEYSKSTLQTISGQKAAPRKAKKAIAGFKLREGEEVGLVVTLRGDRMYDFLNRLINIYAPRIRDFKGFKLTGFDNQGNYSIGFRDTIPFAEISNSGVDKQFGVSITLTIKNSTPSASQELLTALGFPMKKE